ncbi:MAG TPA: hypothetical protein VHZ52_14655 [Acidobacteriaceae bacterium]|nr:hypothetical protein [Acidobacteriaceae bacterium]
MRSKRLRIVFPYLILGACLLNTSSDTSSVRAQSPPPPDHPPEWASHRPPQIASTQVLKIGGAELQVDFAVGALDLPTDQILPWLNRAAQAVTVYYGHFPVSRDRILIVPVQDEHGVVQGTTWGDMRGMPAFTRIRLGQHTTVQDLADDWTMTHELVHNAFPSLPDDQHWMEEGLSTYVEPIARVQAGELKAAQIWHDMMDGMPKGEPRTGDRGLDNTHTWGRTYWGGGLFCLVADVNIRRQTHNRKGLRDALRAIVAAGGTIDHEWPLMKALEVGDKATGTTVLTDQYKQWSQTPMPVDLPALWRELGVSEGPAGSATLDPHAPLAAIRDAIMAR